MARINIEISESMRAEIDKIVERRRKETKRKVSIKEVLLAGVGLKDS